MPTWRYSIWLVLLLLVIGSLRPEDAHLAPSYHYAQAFYERDVDRLRLELVTVFNIDTFRRLLCECILPMLLQRVSSPTNNSGKHKKHDDSTGTSSYAPLFAESKRDPYEQFDDYMEIVIQLGYVTLFASAYPLASLIAIFANLVEVRADCFKLTYVCQRPRPMRTDTCGMWNTLVSCILWLSALTNCMIFGFTSNQLMQYLPQFYTISDAGHTRLAPGKGWIVIFIIFGVERLLVYTGLLIYAIVPEVPEDVVEELERRHFVKMEESKREKEDRLSTMSGLQVDNHEPLNPRRTTLPMDSTRQKEFLADLAFTTKVGESSTSKKEQ